MEWVMGKTIKYMKCDGPLKCPLKGNLLININNFVLNKNFPLVPLIPSGQYRIDFAFTEASRNNIYVTVQLYIEISDNRIEQY